MENLSEYLAGNEKIKEAISDDSKLNFLECIQEQIARKKCFLAPVQYEDNGEERKCKFRFINIAGEEEYYLVAFTSVEDAEIGEKIEYIPCDILYLLDLIYDSNESKVFDVAGLAINPWSDGVVLNLEQIELLRKNSYLHEAIRFATTKHEGQYRKGTYLPYIVHPIETLQILSGMYADQELLMAGVLHDTLEDTDTSYEELELMFGRDVANLVLANTEDKNKTWEERKEATIEELKTAPFRLKMLIFADKLANLRAIARDYALYGDELWSRFQRPKEKQAWYYSSIQDLLWEFQFYPKLQALYGEMVDLYKDVFVSYYLDEEKGKIYQQNTSGEIFVLKKGLPEWKSENKISKKAIKVERKYAERIEDNWNEPFWALHEQDLTDCRYHLYSSRTRSLEIRIVDKQLTFLGEDFSTECEMINGKDEYDFRYVLDEENTHRFLVQLRLQYGVRYKLATILQKAFGEDDGSEKFRAFCEALNIGFQFTSY